MPQQKAEMQPFTFAAKVYREAKGASGVPSAMEPKLEVATFSMGILAEWFTSRKVGFQRMDSDSDYASDASCQIGKNVRGLIRC